MSSDKKVWELSLLPDKVAYCPVMTQATSLSGLAHDYFTKSGLVHTRLSHHSVWDVVVTSKLYPK